jgi:hypothetical protein
VKNVSASFAFVREAIKTLSQAEQEHLEDKNCGIPQPLPALFASVSKPACTSSPTSTSTASNLGGEDLVCSQIWRLMAVAGECAWLRSRAGEWLHEPET